MNLSCAFFLIQEAAANEAQLATGVPTDADVLGCWALAQVDKTRFKIDTLFTYVFARRSFFIFSLYLPEC